MAGQVYTWVLLVALALGIMMAIGAGGTLVIRLYYANPVRMAELVAAFLWIGRKTLIAFLPKVFHYLIKRNEPEVEALMHECERRGGKWNNFTKRCE